MDLERPALERRLHQERLERLSTNEGQRWLVLGKPSFKKSAVFLNIVQKAFDPPSPLSFEHLSYFAGGVF